MNNACLFFSLAKIKPFLAQCFLLRYASNLPSQTNRKAVIPCPSFRQWLFVFFCMSVLSGCSGGSGESTSNNTNTAGSTAPAPSDYAGPAPLTDDVQSFKINVWDNLAAENRCGACHGSGGQAPSFVRSDDINAAYNAVLSIVDLSSPASSTMVSKVSGGHNCWLTADSICGDIITNYIGNWASTTGGASNVVTLSAPIIKEVSSSKKFPVDSNNFVPIHNVLSRYCAGCHVEDSALKQQPYFASSDIDIAFEAAKSKINLNAPQDSRLVVRLRTEFHNCWSDCSANAQTMQDAIQTFTDSISLTLVDPTLVLSKALNLAGDGIVASSGGRVENNVVALYEFKAGSGATAYDTSGVVPATNLNLIGDVDWLGSWGIELRGGKAQASTSSSQKLHQLITATNEYSIEAWVIPENVTQDGPARIVSYSGGDTQRNFTLGQTLYNYDFLNRSGATDANGQPALSTADDDERLQATLQHVVLTYDPVNGRRIYVNGEDTGDIDGSVGATLIDWDDSFALVVGSEVSNGDAWRGSLRFLAIHNRSLSLADVAQNHSVGVGEKFFLLFSVSHLIAVNEAYVAIEVQQFDNYGYLFNAPFFVSLDANASLDAIALRGMRIGVNGREADAGQAWATLDTSLDDTRYVDGRQLLSSLGSVIALEQGPAVDEFFLTFDQLGTHAYVRVDALPVAAPVPVDVVGQASLGLRSFEEINASMAAVTGVSSSSADVKETFDTVKQQLPINESIEGFLAAHQMGVTQLAVEYCSALVGELGDVNTTLRDGYFSGFNFNESPDQAFDTAGRQAIINPLLERLLVHNLPVSAPDYSVAAPLAGQPSPVDISAELNNLIDRMAAFCPAGCNSEPDRTIKVVKATCAAAIGSALLLMQ